METWRQVEVAACEELPGLLGDEAGPTEAELEAIRRARFTVAGGRRTRASHRSRRGRIRGCAGRLGRRGGTVDPLRVDLLGRARHGARPPAARGRRGDRPGRVLAGGGFAARAREHALSLCVGRTHGVHAEPTTFGVKLAGFAFEAHRNALRLERAFAQATVGAVSGAVGTYAATSARVRDARPGPSRPRARGRLHAGRRARPPRRADGRHRPRRRRPGAVRDRDPPPPAHRGARGAGALPRRPEGLLGDAPQAQPDQERADLGPRAGAARKRPVGARERGPVARARYIPFLGRARDPARLHDPARLPTGQDDRAGRRNDRERRADAREPRAHPRSALLPARPARAHRGGRRPGGLGRCGGPGRDVPR